MKPSDGMSRRRFISTATGAGAAAAVGLAASSDSSAARASSGAPGFADAVLEAFKSHRLVALGAADSLQEHYDALGLLLSDPKLPGVIDAIVVEWGNPLYQDTIDRFISGHPVADADLRPVWRNTTQSPLGTWDAPVYEQFYRTVRAVNWRLPSAKRIRVLLGDSPIDWAKITNASQLRSVPNRDHYVTSLVKKQVLAKGKRALLCYGMTGLFRGTGLTGTIEKQTGQRVYVLADLVTAAGDRGRQVAAKLARYQRDSVIATAGTWLGKADAALFVSQTSNATTGKQANPFCGVPLAKLIDAGLYPGNPQDLTMTWPDPAIYLDPTYWKELQRRNQLQGSPVDLNSYRQEHPAHYGQQKPGCASS